MNKMNSVDIFYILGQMKNNDIALSIIRTVGAFNSPFILPLIFILISLYLFFLYKYWFSRLTKDFFTGKDINPNSAPRIKPGKSTKLVNVYILFNWLFTFSLNVLNLAILGIIILWIYNGNSDWLPARWIVPLIWYQALFQYLLGESIGRLVTIFLLLGIFSPILLWLLMYIFSLLKTCKRVLISLLSFKRVNRQVKIITQYLCNQLNISSPYLYIENTDEIWPNSLPLLPTSRFCIINLSNRLVTNLTEKQLTLILAHELAHTTLHVKKLWIMQLLSIISIVGPGYLTLLLDYRKMELEADGFSVYVTGDRQAFIELLEKKDILEFRIRLDQIAKQRQRTEIRANLSDKKKGIIFGVKELYKFHFENALWGYLYPLPRERSLRLRCRFDLLTENSRKVIELAEEEAKRLEHNFIGIEHLLLGLTKYEDDEVMHVLQMLCIEPARILSSVEAIIEQGDKTVYGDIGLTLFTENARRALELAGEEADCFGHKHLSPLLILLGLLSLDEGVVANVLTSQGINLMKARQEVLTLLK
jgi:Zn-dependent protease with chaperone function